MKGQKMKDIKELIFEELTIEQKLGLVNCHLLSMWLDDDDERIKFIIEEVRRRAVGAVWIQWSEDKREKCLGYIKRVREAADYPVIIITDAESGIGEFKVGQHNAVGCTDSEEHAYAFGLSVGVTLKKLGYDMVCNPILDIKRDGWTRSYGSDKYRIAKLAAAEARGLHDAGILTMGKHYPSGVDRDAVDTHMAEAISDQTEAELLDYSLYAYLELMKDDLLDGLMPGHHRFVNIDPSAPASLSRLTLDVIRKQGFDGVMMTDALCMMGIRANYGREECLGLAIEAGEDFALVYDDEPIYNRNSMNECYEKGIISDKALDEAVRRILKAQHKAYLNLNPKIIEIDEKNYNLSKQINRDSVIEIADEGIAKSLDRSGKYYFALMVRNESVTAEKDGVEVDTFSNGWHYPAKIKSKILELFPNSHVEQFYQFPTQGQNGRILSRSLGYDETIFITFSECLAYTGPEHLTRRVETLISAMQSTSRISTLIHYGNVKVLENLPHIPRVILGGVSTESTLACIETLAGENEAKGSLTYELNLK